MSTDFLTDQDYDLLEDESGDWMEGDSDWQHIHDLLELEPGELKYDPLIGVGVEKQINGKADGNLKKNIHLQLQAAGYRINQLLIENDTIDIDADREG